MIRPLSRVYLYEEPAAESLDFGELKAFIEGTVGVPVELRGEFVNHHLKDLERAATDIAWTKVRNLGAPHAPEEPMMGEIRFESRLIRNPAKRVVGIVYDGYHMDAVWRAMLQREERRADLCHVGFTFRLLGTFNPGDGRYHARTVVCGYPSIVSTTGIVEAPAKPREYYALKHHYRSLGMTPPLEELKGHVEGSFIDYDDPRMTEVAKGIVLQAIFHQATGEAFCESKDCRLFDAHWQADLIHAQIESGELCPEHRELAREMTLLPRERR
jgi:hypothetical protein